MRSVKSIFTLGVMAVGLLVAAPTVAEAQWPVTSYYGGPTYSSYYYPPVAYPSYPYVTPAPVYRSYYYPGYNYVAPTYVYPAPTVSYYTYPSYYSSYYYRAPILRGGWRPWY